MEYLLSKIYSNPVYSSKKLTTFQLSYFYDYFKFECHSNNSFSSSESQKEKRRAIRIYKIIRHELKKRGHLGISFYQIN